MFRIGPKVVRDDAEDEDRSHSIEGGSPSGRDPVVDFRSTLTHLPDGLWLHCGCPGTSLVKDPWR